MANWAIITATKRYDDRLLRSAMLLVVGKQRWLNNGEAIGGGDACIAASAPLGRGLGKGWNWSLTKLRK